MYEALLIFLGAVIGATVVLVTGLHYVKRITESKSGFCTFFHAFIAGFAKASRLQGLIIDREHSSISITFEELERAIDNESFYGLKTSAPPPGLELEH